MKTQDRIQLGLSLQEAVELMKLIESSKQGDIALIHHRLRKLSMLAEEKNVFISKITKQPEVQTQQKERGTSTKGNG